MTNNEKIIIALYVLSKLKHGEKEKLCRELIRNGGEAGQFLREIMQFREIGWANALQILVKLDGLILMKGIKG